MKKLPHFFQSEYSVLKWLTSLFVIFLQTTIVNAITQLFKTVKVFNLKELAVFHYRAFLIDKVAFKRNAEQTTIANFLQNKFSNLSSGWISIDWNNLEKDAVHPIENCLASQQHTFFRSI